MRTKLIALLLAMSLCGFWGCARSKSIDTAADGTQPAIDQNLEEAPAPSSAIADNLEQAPAAPAVDQNRREAPVPGSAIAHKLGRTPAVAQHKPRLGGSEEHTSELQSPCNLVCRLLLEKKKKHAY